MTTDCSTEKKVVDSFLEENKKEGIRVFVAGGSRSGNNPVYEKEAYSLGKQIIQMDFKLDFGLSNKGLMGAVARGVLDTFNQKQCAVQGLPVHAITTETYYKLYETDKVLLSNTEVVIASSLEERKRKLLSADFVVFLPGGVGTLDEMAFDCVAMQDGLIPVKPFIIYNIDGYFHHLLEFLKVLSDQEFAEPVPFIVVDNHDELKIAFRLLKLRYNECADVHQAYANARRLAYELPYFIKKKNAPGIYVEDIIANMEKIDCSGTEADKQNLKTEIETAYLEKEIERMYARLAKTSRDTGIVSDKLSKLKERREKAQG